MAYKVCGREVGNIGFGLMSLTWARTTPLADEEAFAVMRAALEAGCNYWDGGELYGTPEHNSLTLLNKYFERYPGDADRVVLNIKGCSFENFRQDSSPEGVDRSIASCVRQLGPRGRIHQFEAARKDPRVPIEVTMAAYARHVAAGRIAEAALSEVSAETIRRAAAVGRVGAVEVELSLWNTLPLTNGVARACAELDIPILAYSPLGRGALTGAIRSTEDIPKGDFRHMLPRFQAENLENNLKLLGEVEHLARKKQCTLGQIAISWIVALSRRPGMPRFIPIPGTSSAARARENAREVELTDEEMDTIDEILARFPVVGERYHKHGMELIET